MGRIYKMAVHIHEKFHICTRTAFFLCTVTAFFILGLLFMTAAVLINGKAAADCWVTILTGTLYIAAGFGFFGGIIYLMRK